MTNDELKRLRELADAATPGPWRASGSIVRAGTAPGEGPIVHEGGRVTDASMANADLIAAARAALPALLDEIERLQEELRVAAQDE